MFSTTLDAALVDGGEIPYVGSLAATVGLVGLCRAVEVHAAPLQAVLVLRGEMAAYADINVQRGIGVACRVGVNKAAVALGATRLGVPPTTTLRREVRIGLDKAVSASAITRQGIPLATPLRREARVAFGKAGGLTITTRLAVAPAGPAGLALRTAFRAADATTVAIRVPAIRAVALAGAMRASSGPAEALASALLVLIPPAIPLSRALDVAVRKARRPTGIRPPRGPSDWPLPPPYWGGETLILPVRESYTVFNQAYLKRADGTPIDCSRITIETDYSSWSRRITGEVPFYERDKVSVEDGPVEVEIGANGVVWKAIIKKCRDVRDFGRDAVTFYAYSKSIALDAPAAARRTGVNADDSTANQLSLAELELYGFQLEWEIKLADGSAVDWPVPAGAFSVINASPINAIKLLVEPVGAFILPHRTAAAIAVRSRFPRLPWSLAAAAADVSIPEDIFKPLSSEWIEGSDYNGIYVCGTRFGKRSLVRIDGTAGDNLLDPVANPMLTDSTANGLCGSALLAACVKRRSMQGVFDIYPEIGVVEPGQVMSITGGDYPWKAICTSSSVSIQWGGDEALTVEQSIGMDRYYV